MKTSFLNTKYACAIIVVVGALFFNIFFKKESRIFITDIYKRSFDDTIFNVYSEKYKGRVIVVAKLKSCDTSLIIQGANDSLHLHFSSYSDLGLKTWEAPNYHFLLKKANNDTFYLRKGNKKIWFKLYK